METDRVILVQSWFSLNLVYLTEISLWAKMKEDLHVNHLEPSVKRRAINLISHPFVLPL